MGANTNAEIEWANRLKALLLEIDRSALVSVVTGELVIDGRFEIKRLRAALSTATK